VVRNQQRRLVKFYSIDLLRDDVKSVDLSHELKFAQNAVFNDHSLYVRSDHTSVLFNCQTREVIERTSYSGHDAAIQSFAGENHKKRYAADAAYDFNISLPGYGIMFRFKEVSVNSKQELVLGHYTLSMIIRNGEPQSHFLHDAENQLPVRKAKEKGMQQTWFPGKGIHFSKWVWDDGSFIVTDSRGLLHLKSADTRLPEVTIVSVNGVGTACWASDGAVSGNTSFIETAITNLLKPEQFYKIYIEPFIDSVLHS
jgi:MoxR-vWA-beta-propeller ternary system protein